MRWACLAAAIVLVACAPSTTRASAESDFRIPAGWKRVCGEDFASQGALGAFAFSDASAWSWHFDEQLEKTDYLHCSWVELEGASEYLPPHRSPLNLALVRELEVRDFTLQLHALQTGREYGHRDLCIVFGFQDPAHYYYVHLASAPDDHAHNVFLVNGADRTRLAEVPGGGIDWGDEVWHRLRIERTLDDGGIRVFFDDLEQPFIETSDTTLDWGRVGFGSFDDTGRFTNLLVWAPEQRVPENAAFE